MSLWQEIEFWYFRKAQTVIWNVLEYKNLFLKSFPTSLCVLLLFLNKHSELIPDLFIFVLFYLVSHQLASNESTPDLCLIIFYQSFWVLVPACPLLIVILKGFRYLFISNLWRLQTIWLWPLILYLLEKDKFCS